MNYEHIIWPADARNLTTLTIHDMIKRKTEEREKLLRVLGYYFPKLEDIRCSYEGGNGCMRRYRLAGGQLKWWYTGEVFKTLPDEPTAEQWFNRPGVSGDGAPRIKPPLSLRERMLAMQIQN